MEVDEGDLESERRAGPKIFFAGIPIFNQMPLGAEDSKIPSHNASTVPSDFSPLGATLPTVSSPQVLGPSGVNPKLPPPPVGRPEQNAGQSDAMAIHVEKIFQQKEKEKEQFKVVIKQKEAELAQAKEKFQRDFDQSKAEHQAHLQSLETKINEVEANHETQNLKSQRELAL